MSISSAGSAAVCLYVSCFFDAFSPRKRFAFIAGEVAPPPDQVRGHASLENAMSNTAEVLP